MEKDNKVVLGAILIMLVSMLSFNLNEITGKSSHEGLPDLKAEAHFVNLETGENIRYANVGDKVDIIVKIKNEGKGMAPAGDKKEKIKHRFELKIDGKKTKEKGLKKTFYLANSIKPSDYTIKHLSQITSYSNFIFSTVGEHCIDVKLDTGKELAEINEDNDFLDLGCVTVFEAGKPLPTKEEEKTVTTKKKAKKIPPTEVTLQLLEYHDDNKIYTEILVNEKDCDLIGNKPVSCSFKAELRGPNSGGVGERQATYYLVRAFASTNFGKIRHVRIIDSSNKVFLSVPCSAPKCELKTGEISI